MLVVNHTSLSECLLYLKNFCGCCDHCWLCVVKLFWGRRHVFTPRWAP